MVGLWQPGFPTLDAVGFGSRVGPGKLQQLRLQQAGSHFTAAGARANGHTYGSMGHHEKLR